MTGISYDSGYADYMVAPAQTLALVPQELSTAEAAPLLCAGTMTYNFLRHSGAQAGDLVAVARGKDKEPLARNLGARHYIDSSGVYRDAGRARLRRGQRRRQSATLTKLLQFLLQAAE